MIISCTNCGQHFELPESKVPETPKFSIKCPSCREKIVAEGRNSQNVDASAPTMGGKKSGGRKISVEPDIFPPGSQVMFSYVQSSSWNSAIESFFSSQGYYISKAKEIEEAVLKLRLNQYNVVVVDDRYSSRAILDEIGNWPGTRRRWVNVILIGDTVTSMNPNEAFSRGVNAYLNINDINRAQDLFDEILKGFELHNEPWVVSGAKT